MSLKDDVPIEVGVHVAASVRLLPSANSKTANHLKQRIDYAISRTVSTNMKAIDERNNGYHATKKPNTSMPSTFPRLPRSSFSSDLLSNATDEIAGIVPRLQQLPGSISIIPFSSHIINKI